MGAKLKEGYNALVAKYGMEQITNCGGFDCRGIINFLPAAGDALVMKTLMQQEMIKRGILWGGFHNMSFSHSDADVEYTLKAYDDVLPIIKKAVEDGNAKDLLKGEVLEMVFRKTKY
jgi:glutamate-1-semialdehyde 2,1-aminomutase/spore coat polysaccharide biosynthesis protein SpsF